MHPGRMCSLPIVQSLVVAESCFGLVLRLLPLTRASQIPVQRHFDRSHRLHLRLVVGVAVIRMGREILDRVVGDLLSLLTRRLLALRSLGRPWVGILVRSHRLLPPGRGRWRPLIVGRLLAFY